MRLKTTLFTALLTLMTTAPATAQTTSQVKSDNMKKAQAAYQKGDTKSALKHLDAEIRQHPSNTAAYFGKADILERTEGKGAKKVLKCYAAAMSAPGIGAKDYSYALGGYAAALLESGDTTAADAAIGKALAERPSSATMAVKGAHLIRLGQYAQALPTLRSAAEAAKTDSLADQGHTHGLILACLCQLGLTEEFDAEVATLQEVSPDDVAWRETAFDYLLTLGRRGEAADQMMQMAALGGADGNIARASQCAPEIVARAEQMTDADPQAKLNALTLATLASMPANPAESLRLSRQYGLGKMMGGRLLSQLYFRTFVNSQALRLLSDEARMAKASRIDKTFLQATGQMALCLARMGRMDEARTTLSKTFVSQQYNEMAYAVFAQIMSDYANRYSEAITYADKAIDIWRESDANAIGMMCHYRLGHKAKARLEADRLADAYAKAKKNHDNGAKATTEGFRFGTSRIALAYAIKGDTATVRQIAAGQDDAQHDDASTAAAGERQMISAEAYGILGMTDEALACVRTAFENGYRDFRLVEASPELAAVRERADYKALAEEFKAKYEAELKSYGK